VPLKHRLKSGDTVEVITSPSQMPSKDWLKIVRSSRAKAKIRTYIKLQERERADKLGREMLDKAIRPYGVTLSKMERTGSELLKAAQSLNARTLEELYVFLGYGRITVGEIIPLLIPKEALEKKLESAKAEDESFLKRVFKAATKRSETRNAITVANLDDVLIRFGRCCSPLPGDSISGFITRGRGVTIHTSTCAKALDNDANRRVDVRWNLSDKQAIKRHVRLRVVSLDEPGLLALMSQTISSCGVNITSANIRTTKDRKAICLFDVEVNDLGQLQKVSSALESKRGVITVERTKS
jgi:guanosine-3',5'-bis(diphosphate) 3'-pyrophosphohydrolase